MFAKIKNAVKSAGQKIKAKIQMVKAAVQMTKVQLTASAMRAPMACDIIS